jgi:hypothetical protein
MTARYGQEMWEREQLVFDTFVRLAQMPLQYVFARLTGDVTGP